MSLFRGWSFSRKLVAVNASYLLPCAVLIYFLIKDKEAQIDFNQRERDGVAYQQPLEALLHHVGQYKLLLQRVASGQDDLKSKMPPLRDQVERDFGALEERDAALSDVLKINPGYLAPLKMERAAFQAIRADWLDLLERQDGLSRQEGLDRFNKLIASIRLAINHVGNTSNLILDPDLDSYYIMDTTLIAIPQSHERIQEAMVYAQSVAGDQPFTEEQKIKLSVLGTQLKDDVARISSSIQTALTEDKNFNGTSATLQKELPRTLKLYVAETEALTQGIFELIQNPAPAGKINDLLDLGDSAMEANLVFWDKAAEELDYLVKARVDALVRGRWTALALALLAWLPAVIIAAVTIRRINKSFITSVSKLEAEATVASQSSMHLASASQVVSSGSTEQAAAIQETGASMSEMASMVARSSTQAVSSQDLARKVQERTQEGTLVMERMVHSMESIREANAQLQNIGHIINDISGKTTIINDIVGKTQLLSFNASIEAARAGQHGRGFAVVAEEVGNLAQMSGNAAKEISNLIDDSRQQVDHILKQILERVTDSKAVTEQAREIFGKIATDIGNISTQIESISEASREQQFGIEQIAKAMTQMDQSTQSNNSAAHTAARLSDQLMGQSRKLMTIAQTVSVLVVGKAAAADAKREAETTSGKRSAGDTPAQPKLTDGGMDKLVDQLADRAQKLDQGALGGQDGATPDVDANDGSFRKVA